MRVDLVKGGGQTLCPRPPLKAESQSCRSAACVVADEQVRGLVDLMLMTPRDWARGWRPRGGLKTVTRAERNSEAGRQRALDRDRGSQRISRAVDAQRRLNARRADSTWSTPDSVGLSDPATRMERGRTTRRACRCRILRGKGAHMPRVEVLTEVSPGDPEAVLTEHVPSEMLSDEHYAGQLLERMGWALETRSGGSRRSEPTMAARRGTLRLARLRRATARGRAPGAQPRADVTATPRRASSTSSPSTLGVPRGSR